ncbi:MAG: tRNA-dihydrouridine synthase, partial [Desulfobacteria bacterium]
CRENGADIVVTEMVSAKGLLCDPVRSGRYLAYDEAERPVGAQLFGSDPGEIAEAAAEVARRGFDCAFRRFRPPEPRLSRPAFREDSGHPRSVSDAGDYCFSQWPISVNLCCPFFFRKDSPLRAIL